MNKFKYFSLDELKHVIEALKPLRTQDTLYRGLYAEASLLYSEMMDQYQQEDYIEFYHDTETDHVCTIIYKQLRAEVYLDDYGQCYYFKIFNPIGTCLGEGSCGTYNSNYKQTVIDYINVFLS